MHPLLKAQPPIGHFRSPHKIVYDLYRRLRDQAERAQREASSDAPGEARAAVKGGAAGGAAPAERTRKPGKLSFKEQRELEGMEALILAAEERKSALEATLADPATYQKDGASVARLRGELEGVTAEVERLYARWQELEGIRAGGGKS